MTRDEFTTLLSQYKTSLGTGNVRASGAVVPLVFEGLVTLIEALREDVDALAAQIAASGDAASPPKVFEPETSGIVTGSGAEQTAASPGSQDGDAGGEPPVVTAVVLPADDEVPGEDLGDDAEGGAPAAEAKPKAAGKKPVAKKA